MKKDLYFKSIDDTTCYSLERHLLEAKEDELLSVKLIEAIRDNSKEYAWCSYHGEVTERNECTKVCCSYYEANKSGRGTCIHRGKLYFHGEEIEFNVEKTLKELDI